MGIMDNVPTVESVEQELQALYRDPVVPDGTKVALRRAMARDAGEVLAEMDVVSTMLRKRLRAESADHAISLANL